MDKKESRLVMSPSSEDYARSDVESGICSKTDGKEHGVKGLLKSIFLTVETSGIQRVTDEDRLENTTKVWHACTFW
jgi:hypothetical protein